uniref:Uncharacterized protein n=1 Tax=Parascaris equorum TaxID=6256 RepID=A0A914RWW6_PAREQ
MLALLNAAQMIGAALILTDCLDGMCANTSNGGGPLFSYRKQKDEATTGDLPDAATYYPRFSGLTSPSYDDLFDCDGGVRTRFGMGAMVDSDFYQQTDLDQMRSGDQFNYSAPLMMSQRKLAPKMLYEASFMYFSGLCQAVMRLEEFHEWTVKCFLAPSI